MRWDEVIFMVASGNA